ncbi:hypothetical protein ABZ467_37030 [Streptomyces sp. NPDC005727]|uniref:hypothetical protein n=1 Tax=Streptomyces sp. NPDC005727 TaxID=3157053 RepID=UPI00340D01F6
MTRGELGARCGLSRTTLYEVAGRLVDSGLVIATVPDTGPRRPGRPAEKLALNPAAGPLLGIDFGRCHVRLAAITAAGDEISTVLAGHTLPPLRVMRLHPHIGGGFSHAGMDAELTAFRTRPLDHTGGGAPAVPLGPHQSGRRC